MCFSATASFGASAVILTIGIISLKKSRNLPQKILSCIPLVFGVQQFTEGILWLSLSHPDMAPWDKIAAYAFLVFAQVIWPTLVPLSVMLMEKEKHNRRILAGLLVVGVALSSYLAYCLMFYNVHASISCYHIQYDLYYPIKTMHSGLIYLVPTVVPPVISSIKRLRLLGLVILISYLVTKVYYEDYLISVWCYFAAVISVIVLWIIVKLNKDAPAIHKQS